MESDVAYGIRHKVSFLKVIINGIFSDEFRIKSLQSISSEFYFDNLIFILIYYGLFCT